MELNELVYEVYALINQCEWVESSRLLHFESPNLAFLIAEITLLLQSGGLDRD